MTKRFPTLLVACAVLGLSAGAQGREILVSAASSLTDVLTSLKPEAEAAAGARVVFNFGGSGMLRQQIEAGARVDVFFSAAAEDMDRLVKAGLVAPGTRMDLLSNSLALIGGDGQAVPSGIGGLEALLASASLLALGNPDSVPAGRYAVQALKSLGLYGIVEKKLALAGNVRQVLQFVETGSAPLGIVFATDAASVKVGSPVKILYDFPAGSLATPVVYPVAIVAASPKRTEAGKFIAFLQGARARDAFTKAGFKTR